MNAVFCVSTEYHLLVTLGIVNKYYSKPDDKVVIYRISPNNGKRLTSINSSATKCQYKQILYDYEHPTKDLKDKIKELICEKPDVFFVFLEERSWFTYLFSKLHKLGTKIVLLPDGMKVYMHQKSSRVTSFKNDIKYFISNIRIGVPFPIAKHPRLYADNKYIDEVWMEYPEQYENKSKKIVKQYSLPSNIEFLDELNQVFGYSMNEEEKKLMKNGPILFLDSPFSDEPYFQRTLELICQIREKYPNRNLLLKQHPLASKKAKEFYDQLGDVTYLNSKFPAELYIANMQNAIIVSMYSTAMLFCNPSCQYFWIGNCYKETLRIPELHNPTPFIHVVSSIDEI